MEIPYGECRCGCGQKTLIRECSCASRGHVKGEPRKYIYGHATKPRPKIDQPKDSAIKLIALTRDQIATVDSFKYQELMQWPWFARWNQSSQCFYATRNGWDPETKRGYQIDMHSFLCPCAENEITDHRDRNTMNNRIANLRPTNKSINGMNSKMHKTNTSGYRGISWRPMERKWEVYIDKG
jgi:hypothetical protein